MHAKPQNFRDHLLRLRVGDRHSFRIVYEECVQPVYAFVFKYTKSRALTEDIVQDVFVKVWEMREQLDPERSFQALIFKIAKNKVLNTFERSATVELVRREIMIGAAQFSNTTEETINFLETSGILQEGIEQLPPQQKKIFELCKLEGLSHEQAASRLNISPNTINVQMVNSLRFLKNYLLFRHGPLRHF